MPFQVPATVSAGGETVAVSRAWPDKTDEASGCAGSLRSIVIEGRDDDGRLRAGQLRIECDGATTTHLLPAGCDPRLPALAEHAREGTLLVHRMGRRAVVQTSDGYLKALRPKKVAGVRDASNRLGRLARDAGFAAPELVAEGPGFLLYSAVPGVSLHDLGQRPDPEADRSWASAWNDWQTTWPALLTATLDAPRHGPEEEAAVVRTWVDHVVRTGVRGPDLRTLIDLRDRVTDALEALPPAAWVPAHRDLHDKQILADPGNGLGLIDFDTAAVADPALDLANLSLHLEWRHHQGVLSAARRDVGMAAVQTVAVRVGATPAAMVAYRSAARLRLVCVYLFRPRWVATALAWGPQSTSDSPVTGELRGES